MATMNVTIKGTTEQDIEYSPTDKLIKHGDMVTFALQNLEAFKVTISWDAGCPMTDSSNIELNGNSLHPSANRTVSSTATEDHLYNFTVSFEAIVPPGTEEEPEEPGPTHGGLEVSREN